MSTHEIDHEQRARETEELRRYFSWRDGEKIPDVAREALNGVINQFRQAHGLSEHQLDIEFANDFTLHVTHCETSPEAQNLFEEQLQKLGYAEIE